MKIYTRTGDGGDTGLFDGTRVSKADPRVSTCGDVDELNAWLGLVRAAGVGDEIGGMLERIQRDLFALGARLADPAHRIEMRLRYEMDGSIRSGEADFDTQLDDVLNLNLPVLKNNRKSVLDAILEWWQGEKRIRRGPVPRDAFERERARRTDGAGELEPFCRVAVWWLDQRLARMAT